jgi:hypothetical protein
MAVGTWSAAAHGYDQFRFCGATVISATVANIADAAYPIKG